MEDCKCERRLSDPLDPPSEATLQRCANVVEHYLNMSRELNRKSKLPIEVTEEHIKIINRFMEEKKTKKMTKAEAFEHLKGTKVFCKDYDKMESVQDFLRSLGFYWSDASEEMVLTHTIFLHKDGRLSFALSLQYFREHESPELSADDILSIEIVEEKCELEFNYDTVVELAKPLMHYLNEVGCSGGICVSQLGIIHEPMSTLIFNNGIGRIE